MSGTEDQKTLIQVILDGIDKQPILTLRLEDLLVQKLKEKIRFLHVTGAEAELK